MSEQAAVDVRTTTAADRAGVVQALSEAFADDPVFSWIYPEAATRYRVLPGFFRLIESHSSRHGTNLVAGSDAGAAIWAPPGEVIVDPADEEAFGTAIVALSPPDATRLAICNQILDAHHPTDPHWYLSLIGVGDAHRGRGVGSALLRAATERCDAGAAPAYLEATNLDNRRLYERHGFIVTGEMVLPDGPSVWAMWREPAA
jgi:ribosomal protein S18 acetylase RimI-like enzyme